MPKADPAAIAAQNRRKIEKDKRRKQYHDTQVQCTNNSSIVSKRSVEVLYNPVIQPQSKEWFKYFVPKGKRRSPAINRGYWLRMESIKQAVLKIQAAHGTKARIINLGCGFDPFPFQMLSESSAEFEFFDFDYPELVERKMSMIKNSPEILEVIGPQTSNLPQDNMGVILSTNTYKLVGCDLKNCDLYRHQLNTLLNDSEDPVIFIAEVSLAYMKPEHANPVVEILSKLPNSHILVLEQIMPSGDRHFFAQKMLYHFQHLSSPLQCVETYSTKEKQRERFHQYFPNVEVVDLFESWNLLVLSEQKKLVATVEEFDEWEEFIVFCQHYVVIHATNTANSIFTREEVVSDPPVSGTLAMKPIRDEELKFPAACSGKLGIYVHGGLGQTRSERLSLLNGNDLSQIESLSCPEPRMCHSLTSLNDEHLILIGGRTRPGHDLSDVWIFNEIQKTWTKVGTLHEGVSRHGVVAIDQLTLLMLANGIFYKVQIFGNDGKVQFSVSALQNEGESLSTLKSFGFTYDGGANEGYVVGGTVDEVAPEINPNLYKFSLEGSNVKVSLVQASPYFRRIGCMLKLSNNNLFILGGVGPLPQNQETTCLCVNLQTNTIHGTRIPDDAWGSAPVLIGSQLAGNTIIGGGAVCYSFGSHYNKVYEVTFSDE